MAREPNPDAAWLNRVMLALVVADDLLVRQLLTEALGMTRDEAAWYLASKTHWQQDVPTGTPFECIADVLAEAVRQQERCG